MRTRADLVNRVGKFLQLKLMGQPMDPEDYQSIDDELPGLFATINKRGFAGQLPDVEEVEDEIFDPLARWIAARLCTDFSIPLNTLPGFENEPRRSEDELRALTRNPTASDVIRFQNF